MTEAQKVLTNFMEALLKPSTIAIVGASADKRKMGSLPLTFLERYGYKGKVYPINPRRETINNLKCYSNVSEIPDTIDMLVVAVSANFIPDVIKDCKPNQVKTALILSSGYSELGEEGEIRQKELVELANEKGIRLVGP